MRRIAGLTLLPLLPALAQEFPKHNFTFGLGAGVPRSELGSFFDPKVGLNAAYGYRFHRYFQADVGLDTVVGAGNVKEFVNTEIGVRRIRDYQYMLPMGGRAIIPLMGGRLQLFGGGGGTYLRYSEHLSQGDSYYRVACAFCTARSGWGYYATAGFSAAIDRYGRFRLGFAPRLYRGNTSGEPLGAVPGIRTKDHWLNMMVQFGVSF